LCTVLKHLLERARVDYLWPLFSIARKGKFAFNRTHYENVLVTRVHPEYILNENLPGLEDVSLITDAFGKRGWSKSEILRYTKMEPLC
jgi:polyphosphate kinase 2 (PPK2 family)